MFDGGGLGNRDDTIFGYAPVQRDLRFTFPRHCGHSLENTLAIAFFEVSQAVSEGAVGNDGDLALLTVVQEGLPTLRTPPFFWATASDALPATSAVDTSANSTARTISLDMLHLPVVGEPNLSHARRPAVGQVIRVPASRPPLLQPEPHVHLAVHRRG